jgi:hypothetical protein
VKKQTTALAPAAGEQRVSDLRKNISHLGEKKMPAASISISDFLKSQRLCICFFDERRGQSEGSEYEKVLAFYPTTASLPTRTAIAGLAQASFSFAASFQASNEVCIMGVAMH